MPDTPQPPTETPAPHHGGNFRRFFLRGLGILLPTLLTIWLFVWAYGFVQANFAGPINLGVKHLLVEFSPYPMAADEDYDEVFGIESKEDGGLSTAQKTAWGLVDEQVRNEIGEDEYDKTRQLTQRRAWMQSQPDVEQIVRTNVVNRWWNSFTIGSWVIMDLIGLVIAVVLIYIVGWLVGSFIGRRLYHKGEELVHRVPLIRNIYPAIKQVTDFFVGAEKRPQFSAVVAVEYPRKGLWSVGLVTGETMSLIQAKAGVQCLTVFIPSSPTPFTGYVITVPKADTIDLPITIEEAIKFAVSGGVLIPPGQQIGNKPGLFGAGNGGQRPADTEQDPPATSA